MNYRVALHPDAKTELREAARWYEQQPAGLGLRLLDAVDQRLVRIGRWPDAAPVVPDLPDDLVLRRAPLHTFPYHLAYLVEHDTIHVLANAHDHRRPNYGATARSSAMSSRQRCQASDPDRRLLGACGVDHV